MARSRLIKPSFWDDEKLCKLKRDIRLLYIGLWTISDDYGTVRSNPVFIKNSVFPYDEDLRVNDVKSWLDALSNARMLEPFTYNGEGFYNIRTFNDHQRVDKPSKPIVPLEEKARILTEYSQKSLETVASESRDSRETVGDEEKRREVNGSKSKRANALVVSGETTAGNGQALKIEYKAIAEGLKDKPTAEIWNTLRTFVKDKAPEFIDPYVDIWNVFSRQYKLSAIDVISDSRMKKFQTRLQERGFDFMKVLESIKISPHLKGDNPRNWKVTFDWIIENDKNYLKIIEGNYN